MSETKRGELAIRDKAVLHQQRRLKQATQFSHKDSADLLPLDGLKRLGTSKDLQPHSIVQRRLLEGNITRLRGEARDANDRIRSPLADYKDGAAAAAAAVDAEERSESTADDSTEERESLEESEKSLRSDEEEEEEEEDGSEAGARPAAEKTESSALLTALVVQCKCCEAEVKASINTGSQHNHISSSCCRRLGLVPVQDSSPRGGSSSVPGLQLQLGRQTVQCSAYVKEDEAVELCLGLQTLLELKCRLDLGSRVLKLQGYGDELPFLNPSTDSRCQRDTNENL
ncbi:nuclear receptor-interacting protein 2 isoform X2 [Cyclopterus lumpus]|uniref:Nuclear receptor interacting protein 2 n=1 Tax=Cyclopterus lumpus TaxID=8103 RepID=A0A8C3AAY8_CYCLU|nr:nuclear receptor-interacting protein 2 isoform X2 [Cyclopterus lumpus]